MEFTCALFVTKEAVSSYLAFPPLPEKQAVYFCCTGPGVTPAGRYPASCPAEARTFLTCGLSTFAAAIIQQTYYNKISYHTPIRKASSQDRQIYCRPSAYIETAAADKLPENRIGRNIL